MIVQACVRKLKRLEFENSRKILLKTQEKLLLKTFFRYEIEALKLSQDCWRKTFERFVKTGCKNVTKKPFYRVQ